MFKSFDFITPTAWLVIAAVYVFTRIALFPLFGKMGEKRWRSLVPIYSDYLYFFHTGSVGTCYAALISLLFYAVLYQVLGVDPTVCYIVGGAAAFVLALRLSISVHQSFRSGVGLVLLHLVCPPLAVFYLAFSRKAAYIGPGGYPAYVLQREPLAQK